MHQELRDGKKMQNNPGNRRKNFRLKAGLNQAAGQQLWKAVVTMAG